jgi:hypothetical protein
MVQNKLTLKLWLYNYSCISPGSLTTNLCGYNRISIDTAFQRCQELHTAICLPQYDNSLKENNLLRSSICILLLQVSQKSFHFLLILRGHMQGLKGHFGFGFPFRTCLSFVSTTVAGSAKDTRLKLTKLTCDQNFYTLLRVPK